jgi:hypothetical protein
MGKGKMYALLNAVDISNTKNFFSLICVTCFLRCTACGRNGLRDHPVALYNAAHEGNLKEMKKREKRKNVLRKASNEEK